MTEDKAKKDLTGFVDWVNAIKTIQFKLNQIGEEYGVSFDSHLILKLIEEKQAITPGQLAKEIGGGAPKTSRKINTLYRKGLITKEFGTPDDQRRVSLAVTDKGRAVLALVGQAYEDWYANHIDEILEINGKLKY
ncbi:MarR family transcriptional regulator [Latilactobacillus curvatus]|uniref:MarR family winged helix-turn-helix transcriptional regulator n=1 Tax=Latilactobacillus curvatus TaxID=28038 RepID=UPI002410BBA8|nr:MarR family transcriptional regulator [Latilactobacillus curvatus]MDG2979232.1 MarR family transcriptional regulator [Latilactobacillus curvatus]MDT3393087.1 MarR family transcriptional regulator [Bacillota bacterium]